MPKPRQVGKKKIVMQMAESGDALQLSACFAEWDYVPNPAA
ncbi:MAG TPA: hypothetical protein VF955_06890 [Pyrinomonadaceae bacterium]